MTYSHYWRLVALASVDFFFTIPLAISVIALDAGAGVLPWVSWDHTHFGYTHVDQIPRVELDQTPIRIVGLEIVRWGPVLCSFVFFVFFGFAEEAVENYRLFASTVAKRLGCKRVPPNSPPAQPPAMNFPMEEVPRIPEYTAVAPKSVYPNNAVDQA